MARVPVAGGELAVTDAGSGPPLLLLHGSGADRTWAEPLIAHLAADFRCLAPDRRGAGESTAPTGGGDPSYDTLAADVLAVVRWAGAARPLVLGASWGAKIALAYAAAGHPCAGVVCLDDMWSLGRYPHEDLYARIACPVRMVFATDSARDFPTGGAYTVSDVVALSVRHPELLISWLPCGHDIGREMPAELAHLVRAFARLVRPGQGTAAIRVVDELEWQRQRRFLDQR